VDIEDNPVTKSFFVCGPTASGKTAFAVDLAEKIGGEIVNADAFQLYRGVEILTAAPTPEEQALVPHHLFGVLDPHESNDAFRYRGLALPVLSEILARDATPVVVSGSGLYIKFLTHGPSPVPPGDPELRRELDALPLGELLSELRSLDPVEAGRIDPCNRRYVSRSLEICRLTGRRASELRDQWKSAAARIDARLRGVFLRRSRAEIHGRIARRTREMLDGGAIEEVRRIAAPSPTLARAHGFPEITALLAGEIDRAACEERINAITRQYVKRQETWFRKETWLEPRLLP
jgi:tRNA dimethylallyltransferase